jgi:hypothetical protein
MVIPKSWVFGAASMAALALPGVCLAEVAAEPSFSRTIVAFAAAKSYFGGTLNVVGPGGYAASASSKSGLPSLDLSKFGRVADGQYTYQLSAATGQVDTSTALLNNGRAKNVRGRRSDGLSGVFLVKGGSIVAPVSAAAARSGGDQDQD